MLMKTVRRALHNSYEVIFQYSLNEFKSLEIQIAHAMVIKWKHKDFRQLWDFSVNEDT